MKPTIEANSITISVIVPLYNVEEHIALAAKSLREQNFDGLEVVLVDDGSTDNSLESFVGLLPGMDVLALSQKNTGPGGARNNGILNASGEYVMFLDSDDFFLPNALKNIVGLLEKERPAVLFGKYVRYIPELGIMNEKHHPFAHPKHAAQITEHVLSVYRQPSWNSAWRYVVKREFLLDNHLFFAPSLYCEDLKWALELLGILEKTNTNFSVLNEAYYAYNYKRLDSIMNSQNPKRIIDLTAIIKEALPRYQNRPLVCRELVWQTFYYINEYCTFPKNHRKLVFESYVKLLPMYRMAKQPFYTAVGFLRTKLLFHILSSLLFLVKKIRWKFKLWNEYRRCNHNGAYVAMPSNEKSV